MSSGADSNTGKRRVGGVPVPVMVPSAELDAHLHDKAAEIARSRHSSKTRELDDSSPGNHHHSYDLMTPPEVLLRSALKEAKHFTQEKETEAAIRCWVKASALSRIVHGDTHWEFAKCHIQLGRAYLDICDLPEQALVHAAKGRDILLSPGGHLMSHDTPPEAVYHLAAAHCTVGRVLTAQKKLAPAEKALLLAEKASEKYSKMPGGSTDVQLDLDIVSAMGRLCIYQQRNGLAKDCFKKAIELSKAAHGARNKDLVPLLRQLATAEQQSGEAVRAAETAEEALHIAEASYGSNSEQTASVLTCLAQLQKGTGGPVEDLLQRAYSIYCIVHGAHHERSISCREELCRFLISRDDLKERSVPILKEVIDAKKIVYGNSSREVAHSCELLGSVYLSQGKIQEATKCLVEARGICSSVLGPKHRDTTRLSQTLEIIAGSSTTAVKEKPKGLENRPRFVP